LSGLKVEIAPACEPVSLTVVKNALRIDPDITLDDELVGIYIQAAREDVEDFTGRSFINKGYLMTLDFLPNFIDTVQTQSAYPPQYWAYPRYSTSLWNYSQMIKLPRWPLVQVAGIDYLDSQTQEIQTLIPALDVFYPGGEYTIGDQLEDPNGNVQEVTAVTEADEDGTSEAGLTMPTWATIEGNTTVSGGVTFTNMGTAPDADFIVDSVNEPGRIFTLPGATWPPSLYTPNAVRIHFTAGSGDDDSAVPARAKVAIMQLVAGWYENREPASSPELKKIPYHLERLLWSLRVLDLAPTQG